MGHGSDAEIAAKSIADNSISILRHKPEECGFRSVGVEAVSAALMRELLAVMPTESGDALAAACNRVLDTLPSTDKRRPWVEAVDPVGWVVTMRAGKRANAFKGHSGSGFL